MTGNVTLRDLFLFTWGTVSLRPRNPQNYLEIKPTARLMSLASGPQHHPYVLKHLMLPKSFISSYTTGKYYGTGHLKDRSMTGEKRWLSCVSFTMTCTKAEAMAVYMATTRTSEKSPLPIQTTWAPITLHKTSKDQRHPSLLPLWGGDAQLCSDWHKPQVVTIEPKHCQCSRPAYLSTRQHWYCF